MSMTSTLAGSVLLLIFIMNICKNKKIKRISFVEKILAVCLVAAGFSHSIASIMASNGTILINLTGAIALVASILIGENYLNRKSFKKENWTKKHIIFNVVFFIALIAHILVAVLI